jgi:multiple RNA-binding domain-containing protein 1
VEEEEMNTIGERIITKAIVDQTVEGVSAEEIDPDRVDEIDPDRVEVCCFL